MAGDKNYLWDQATVYCISCKGSFYKPAIDPSKSTIPTEEVQHHGTAQDVTPVGL